MVERKIDERAEGQEEGTDSVDQELDSWNGLDIEDVVEEVELPNGRKAHLACDENNPDKVTVEIVDARGVAMAWLHPELFMRTYPDQAMRLGIAYRSDRGDRSE